MFRRTLVFCAGCLLMNAAWAQSSLDSSISAYSSRYEQEKIHIHFDKDAYLPGETVWMKAYLVSGSKPSYISKNIYFDWTDARGHLLLHSVSPVTEGVSSSSFVIPDALERGVVHVKAYTQWMLNFDEAFLYNKDIPVLTASNEFDAKPGEKKSEISFFAEGGDLVNGVNSVLAFEALDQHGRPVNVSGVIKTSKNNVVDSFHTSYQGMGSCSFKPVNGHQYLALWKDETGEAHTTPLPQIKPNGVVLHMTSYKNDQVQYKLERSVDAVSLNRLTVMGVMDQKVVYKNNVNLVNYQAAGSINTASFPGGIMQLTVLDGDMMPIAERVVFIRNRKSYAKTQMKWDQVNLNKRARNEISLEIPDSLSTNLSISVTDGGLGSDSSYNIYSDLLLSSDLKGNIRDAASYLDDSENANDHLNLLLLTHGWRRFNWEAVVSGKFPPLKYLHDADFLTLKGEIHGAASSLDAGDSIALLMISRDRKKQVLNLPVNSDGKFNQHGLYFYDSVQVVYRFNHVSKINGNSEISLYSDLLPALTAARANEPGYAWMKVPEVVLEKETNGNIIETNEYAVPSQDMSYILTPRSDGSKSPSETAAHYLSTMFAELRFAATLKESAPGTGDGRFTSYSPSGHSALRNNVNISYDGTLVAMDDLKSVSMKEVLFLKFVPKTNPKGLPTLAITSRQSLAQSSILENKTGFAVITGYTPAREFYAPHYATDKIQDYQAADFRSTLYWNPAVRLDRSHRKVSIVFYNNDVSNKFRVVVEGMNQEGKLTHIEELIK
ncbi:MAG: hypothetical protein Q8926_04330 [Bacteroidota bacterium]|nr:hypothetical protein [Bacteroidota bacterium]